MIEQGRRSMSLRDMNKTYVIGFQHIDIAKRVASNVSPNVANLLRIKRSMAENVALDVKRTMMEMQMPLTPVANDITIDVAASLYIPKSVLYSGYNISDVTPTEKDAVVHEVDYNDFMMMPFQNNVGIIMPYDIVQDSVSEYEFLCNVVDPADSFEHFMRSLRFD